MAEKKIERPVFENPFLNIVERGDGSVQRGPEPRSPAEADPKGIGISPVRSRDVTLDPNKKTWLRLYVPRQDNIRKLPVMVYYHGGGFVFSNANSTVSDVFCKGLVEKLGVMVVSLDYRLAPENRLPAAYDDATDCLYWMKSTQDQWVRDYADLDELYLCGTSAGGNLAYQAGLRAASAAQDLKPLNIRGLILHHPFFSGAKRTQSEEKLADDSLLPLYAIDQMFDLCLPKGADHDHEYCNPLANGGSKHIDEMKRLAWRVLVTGCFGDPLVDAAMACANMFEEKGLPTLKFFSDGYHAMELLDPSMSQPFFDTVRDFMSSSSH